MSCFRRYFVPGATYFFTVVTAGRARLFADDRARTLLGEVYRQTNRSAAFETVAIVLLPDHLHAVWTLPAGDIDYSGRWKAIKARFTSRWLASGGSEEPVTDGYNRQRRRGVWQPRFIEHTIRDEADLHAHVDYIHYNPLKHRCAKAPNDWPWSSFHRYVKSGDYEVNWGSTRQTTPDFSNIDENLLE
ncbi:MAG: transposase [Planctomycetes bacterium]|nr:transposase [Planctomycetota bacterium]